MNGLENIKKNRAYLITSNHPGGFLEPIIMACLFPRDLYFMVRGDLFKNRLMRFFLESTHQIPIFRSKDGFSNLRSNTGSMERAVDTLAQNKALLIFVEGSTEYIFKLRPLQKGFIRMGFQAIEKHKALEIDILPIGISFSFLHKMGGDVLLNVGQPISLNAYYSADNAAQSKGIRQVLQDTQEAMSKLILTATTTEKVTALRKDWKSYSEIGDAAFPKIVKNNHLFDTLYEKYPSPRQSDETTPLEVLTSFGAQDDKLNYINGLKAPWKKILWLPALPSIVFTFLPKLAMQYGRDTLVTKLQFKSAMALPIMLTTAILVLLILLFTVGNIYGSWFVILAIFVLTISGICHLVAWENSRK